MSNRIGRLVKDIQYLTDFTIDQVAGKIGYTRPHLNRLMKSGDSKKVYGLLQEKFSKELQNVQNTPVVALQTQGGQKSPKTEKHTSKDILTTVTTKPQFEMKPQNGTKPVDKDATIHNLSETTISQQKLITEMAVKLMDFTSKVIDKM